MGDTTIVHNHKLGISLPSFLLILFIGLKLGGIIAWSWLWVLSPLWIPLAVLFASLLIVGIIAGLVALCAKIFT